MLTDMRPGQRETKDTPGINLGSHKGIQQKPQKNHLYP
jgi:hypothetical protein